MRAIQITGFGPPEVLTLATVPDPTPPPGEVRVRIHAIGVNFSDTERRRAVFDPPELPWVPGREAAGVIDVVGQGVDPALVGARVAYYSRRRGGSYAELATVAVDELVHFPDSVPFATMAAVPVQGLTAWGLVHFLAGVQPATWCSCTPPRAASASSRSSSPGGPGPVSLAPCRPTRRPRSCAASAPSHSATATTSPSACAPPPADAAPTSCWTRSAARPTPRASPPSPGSARSSSSATRAARCRRSMSRRSTRVGAFNLRLDDAPARWGEAKRALVEVVASGALWIDVSRTLPLAAAAQAHHALESRASFGKIVLLPITSSR
jgi:NADPH2:quinone reductase